MTERTDKQTYIGKQQIFYSDFLTDLDKHPSTGALGVVTNTNAIKQALKNIVLTNYGERLYQPNVGGNVSQVLFEPIDGFSTSYLEDSIKTTIFNNENRVASLSVSAVPDQLNNSYNVTLSFTERNSNVIQSVSLVLIRNR